MRAKRDRSEYFRRYYLEHKERIHQQQRTYRNAKAANPMHAYALAAEEKRREATR